MTANNSKESYEGIIRITSKPTGFVEVDGQEEDIIVFEEELNTALNKDRVLVEIIGKSHNKFDKSSKPKLKGKVVKILERAKTNYVGVLKKSASGFSLIPDDFKFYRNIEVINPPKEAEEGLKAYVEMTDWKNPNLNPTGKILEIIGKKGMHETEMRSILVERGIIYDFPIEVEKEAKKIASDFKPDIEDRRDFRNITTFTIDPKDAKDFDDALSYEEIDGETLRIGVHIADVSYFVRKGTELDKEAKKRSFSVYLVDRTIPMLPEVLSNDLCSLNPHVDRLAFSSVFDIDRKTGKVKSKWFGRTIINSDRRFTYEDAQEILDNNSGEFLNELKDLDRIGKIYRAENKKNGAIEFETEEVKFELDENGKPIRVFKKARLDTMKMIEEWMLLANREVASYISDKQEKNGGASIYRIHEMPNSEKIEELAIFVRALGHNLPVKNGEVLAKDINALLSKLEGHVSESLVRTAAVRSMSKAVYSTKNIGHFGLAFEYYTHFTSPIRRYPDLMIHRILDRHLRNEKIGKDEYAEYQKICEQATQKEIEAAQAERESIRYKQVEFMMEKIGSEFEGIISGVTEWGIYVEEPTTKAEGMVRLKEMTDDMYELEEKNYRVVGKRNKKTFTLGDKVKVKLVAADLDRKNLDFKII